MSDVAHREKAPPVLFSFPDSEELSSGIAAFVIRVSVG